MSYLYQKCKKNLGVTVFVSEIKRVVNYTDFEKLSHIIEHGLQGFIIKRLRYKTNALPCTIYSATSDQLTHRQ